MTTRYQAEKFDTNNYYRVPTSGLSALYWNGFAGNGPVPQSSNPTTFDAGVGGIVYVGKSHGAIDPNGTDWTGVYTFYAVGQVDSVTSGVGNVIYGADYNALQVKVSGILGDGTYYGGPKNGYGYGQALVSGLVNPTDPITSLQWDNLVQDLNKAWTHQNGAGNSVAEGYATVNYAQGQPVLYDQLPSMTAAADSMVTNKLNIAINQRVLTNQISSNGPATTWGGGARAVVSSTFTFAVPAPALPGLGGNEASLNYFFNQGGALYIRGFVDTTATGLSAQEQAWYDLVNGWGSTAIDRAVLTSMISAGAPGYTIFTVGSTTSPYTGANITVKGYYNTTNITIVTTFNDGHTPTGAGPDSIRPYLVSYVIDKRTTTGAFTSDAQTYSVTTSFG